MDDNIIKHYSNEDAFHIRMEEVGGKVLLTLTEIWALSLDRGVYIRASNVSKRFAMENKNNNFLLDQYRLLDLPVLSFLLLFGASRVRPLEEGHMLSSKGVGRDPEQ